MQIQIGIAGMTQSKLLRANVPEPKSDTEIAAEVLAVMKAIVRRAIMTLWTLKDPDRRYLNPPSSNWLLSIVRERSESYGWADYRFEPMPHDISQMEIVAGWLAWLRRTEGEQALRRLIAWTLGVQTWRIGQRERCSDQTIRNRIDRSIVAIIRKFAGADISVEIVEDAKITKPYAMVTEPNVVTNDPVILRKVYVYDKGFYLGSKRLNDGRYKAEKYLT
jgi:hypothetical protein